MIPKAVLYWCPFCAAKCESVMEGTFHALRKCNGLPFPTFTPFGFEWSCACGCNFDTQDFFEANRFINLNPHVGNSPAAAMIGGPVGPGSLGNPFAHSVPDPSAPAPTDADDDGETGTMILFNWLMSHHTQSKQDLAAMLMRDFSIKIRKIP